MRRSVSVAKRKPVVLLNRTVSEVSSVVIDNVHAIKKATEHLTELGHRQSAISPGPRPPGRTACGGAACARRVSSWICTYAGSDRSCRRCAAAAAAAEQWLHRPTTAVIAYNDLMAIGFVQAVTAAGSVGARDVSVIGFDNIVDATLVEPHLTTIAAPLVSLGSAAVARSGKNRSRNPPRPRSRSCCRRGSLCAAPPVPRQDLSRAATHRR